jgi:hypothetical protein
MKHRSRLTAVTPEALDPTIQSDAQLCTMLVDEEGIFLVHEAAMPVDDSRVSPGYIAYWRDGAGGDLYVYG